jgi:hypothetical protein
MKSDKIKVEVRVYLGGEYMPFLRIRAMEPKKICTISKGLVDELQQLLQCPRDYFQLEVTHSTFIRDGEIVDGNPIIEVSLFDRGQEVQDQAARIITKYIQSIGYNNVDVIFRALEKNRYYENGNHF